LTRILFSREKAQKTQRDVNHGFRGLHGIHYVVIARRDSSGRGSCCVASTSQSSAISHQIINNQ